MRYIALLAAFLLAPAFSAENCENSMTCGRWTTTRINSGGTVKFNWTHVYEGRDTVFRIDFLGPSQGPKQLKVEGQPIVNKGATMVALPYCADDGCQTNVTFVDLVNRREIGTATLPYRTQIYVEGKWQGDIFALTVSLPDGSGGKDKVVVHRYKLSLGSIVEQR
jgi:hypothetical protein